MKLVQNVAMLNLKQLLGVARIVPHLLVLVACVMLNSCQPYKPLPDWRSGELVVLEDALTPSADSQFNHELVRLLADFLHARLTVIPVAVGLAPDWLTKHRAHLAVFGLRSNTDLPGLTFAPSYQMVAEQWVCNAAQDMPASLAELTGLRIAVVAGSAQEALLRELQIRQPDLHWDARTQEGVDELLDEVAEGKLDVTFANQQQFLLARNFHENLNTSKVSAAEPSQLAWALAADADPQLREQVAYFFAEIRKDGRLHDLIDRFYGFNDRLTPIDAATFLEQIRTTLPSYRGIFNEAAHLSGLDWELVAALAYQESHWDPLATSPTKVRGMMMLTEDTADQLNVDNRLDARQSTLAGARYLAMLRDQLPDRIAEPDRIWMALAAYNQGNGHLEDARILAQRKGMNADRWVDVKKWLPKLTQPEYFESLPHGYARGGEAVILVENIRMYYDMLKRAENKQLPADSESVPYYQLLDGNHKQHMQNFSHS